MNYKESYFYSDTTRINYFGIPFNRDYLNNLKDLYKDVKLEYDDAFKEIGVSNPKSNKVLREFVEKSHALALFYDSLSGKYSFAQKMFSELNPDDFDDLDFKRFVTLKKGYSSYSLNSIVESVLLRLSDKDDRLRDTLIHYGTHTGRSVSRIVNTLAIPKGGFSELIFDKEKFKKTIPFEKKLDFLCKAFRGSIEAPKHHTFIIADLKNIEPLRLAYDTGNARVLAKLKSGQSLYKEIMDILKTDDKTNVKTGYMAYLYGGYLNGIVRQFFNKACPDSCDGYVRDALRTLEKEWGSFLNNQGGRLNKRWMGFGPINGKALRLVSLNNPYDYPKNGVFYKLKECASHRPIAIRGTALVPSNDRMKLISLSNQQRTAWVHKILKHECLKRNLKIVLDVHDEIVIESHLREVEKNKKIYNEVIENIRKYFGGFDKFPLFSEVKVSKQYCK